MNTSTRTPIEGLETYFGGKGHPGTVRRLINAMPPHDVYIEAFAGGAAVLRTKRPAGIGNHAFEMDGAVAALLSKARPPFHVHHGNAFELLPAILDHYTGHGIDPASILVYCDPPYRIDSRRAPVATYAHEFSDMDHIALLAMVDALPCRVMISHLPCDQYAETLARWHTFTFTNHTRRGTQTEQVWCNYTPTERLHEYTFIGDNFRHREQIRRSLGVIRRRLERLPPEAQAAFQGFLQHRIDGDARASH